MIPALTENHHALLRVLTEGRPRKVMAQLSDAKCPRCGTLTFIVASKRRATLACPMAQCCWQLRVEIGEKK